MKYILFGLGYLSLLISTSIYTVIFSKPEKSQYTIFLFSFVFFTLNLVGFHVRSLYAASLQYLISHRGIYDLALERADDKTGIHALTGRMVYEFTGSACEGFTTKFRYVSRLEMEENAPRIHDQQTQLFESADGTQLSILNKNYTNSQIENEFEATAWQRDNGIVVEVNKPETKTHHLSPALFPNLQMIEMLQKAKIGVNFYQTILYDNFETGDKITQATVVIGAQRMNGANDTPVWPITISYFDDEKNPDGLPSYQSRFLLDDRGISHDIVFDYGDFSMRGTLTQLDILQPSACSD